MQEELLYLHLDSYCRPTLSSTLSYQESESNQKLCMFLASEHNESSLSDTKLKFSCVLYLIVPVFLSYHSLSWGNTIKLS